MPRFSVAFGRRKSTADNLENAAVTGPSFRVLERTDVVGSKAFDGGVRLAAATHAYHKSTGSDVTLDDNLFADIKSNRGSGSSNTTKTTLTDNSSRHSNASTAPSSADTGGSDEWRGAQRKSSTDIPVPPIPKSSRGFLNAAGRTFSFGGQKKSLPTAPRIDESPPPSPPVARMQTPTNGRPRAPTSSTSATVTPPRLDDDLNLDLGGDFGKLVLGNDKRASAATLRNDQYTAHAAAPRSLTGARTIQPTPIQIDNAAKVEPSPHSWGSQHSHDQLIGHSSPTLSPKKQEHSPPPPPRHTSPLLERQRPGTSPEVGPRRPLLAPEKHSSEQEDGEDEEARLLKDSLSTVTMFITEGGESASADNQSGSGYRRNEDDDTLFDSGNMQSFKYGNRQTARQHSNPAGSSKVMTPAEFERYRKDKERQDRERELLAGGGTKNADEDEVNYEDDEDEAEKAKQQAKQRRKQEAHMAVYRQQMMKVTGESASGPSSRPSLQMSFSTPDLPTANPPAGTANTSENSDEDEEIPLAILAAHGFPNRARPPNRLSPMASNPNLRASQQPSFQRPMSAIGDTPGAGNPQLPAFARNLPRDPFVGAGLVRNSVRESFSLGGGAAAPGHAAAPPGGLIGVIANEERNRAMRRGSPHLDGSGSLPGTAGFDPIAGIPSHLMYSAHPNPPALSPGDQAQLQMTQQMQQFMQMQMQFMNMMAGQNSNPSATARGHLTSPSVGSLSTVGGLTPSASMQGLGGPEMRRSFVGNESMLDVPYGRGEAQMRTMSMVQPSSASWIQPPQPGGFAPSIRIIGGGYAPSIAPSERSNIGLPGRYRPVSHVPPPQTTGPSHLRTSSTMSGAIPQSSHSAPKSGSTSDDDDEEGWEAMKAKREKKKSLWKSKKSISDDIGALIN